MFPVNPLAVNSLKKLAANNPHLGISELVAMYNAPRIFFGFRKKSAEELTPALIEAGVVVGTSEKVAITAEI